MSPRPEERDDALADWKATEEATLLHPWLASDARRWRNLAGALAEAVRALRSKNSEPTRGNREASETMTDDERDVVEILGEWLDDDYPTVGEVRTIRRVLTEIRELRARLDVSREAVEEARAALSEYRGDERAGVERWQPIETAPKDGTPVLVWDGNGVLMREWLDGGMPDLIGWHAEDGFMVEADDPPTHWMPLPAPPAEPRPTPASEPSPANPADPSPREETTTP